MKAYIATTLVLGAQLALPAKAEEAASRPAINVEELIQSLNSARQADGDISVEELIELLETLGIRVHEETAVPATVCGGDGGGWG